MMKNTTKYICVVILCVLGCSAFAQDSWTGGQHEMSVSPVKKGSQSDNPSPIFKIEVFNYTEDAEMSSYDAHSLNFKGQALHLTADLLNTTPLYLQCQNCVLLNKKIALNAQISQLEIAEIKPLLLGYLQKHYRFSYQKEWQHKKLYYLDEVDESRLLTNSKISSEGVVQGLNLTEKGTMVLDNYSIGEFIQALESTLKTNYFRYVGNDTEKYDWEIPSMHSTDEVLNYLKQAYGLTFSLKKEAVEVYVITNE